MGDVGWMGQTLMVVTHQTRCNTNNMAALTLKNHRIHILSLLLGLSVAPFFHGKFVCLESLVVHVRTLASS